MKCIMKWNKKQKGITDDRGSAIVMVLVIIAFVSILASIMCYRSVLNYQMKVTDSNSKDNFYSAEGALDEVRTGLQTIASQAVGESYIEVMQTYHNYSNEERAKQFTYLYMEKLKDKLKQGSDESLYDVAILQGYLSNTVDGVTDLVGAKVGTTGTNTNKMVPYTKGLVLEDVIVTYTDASGYVSIIETDIQFFLPKVDFNEAFRLPDILQYCLIANQGIEAIGTHSTIEGSVYAGKNGVTVKDTASLQFTNSDLVVTDGTILADNSSSVSVTGDVWATDVKANSYSNVTLNGNIYVGDDTTADGSECVVKYTGAYYGFGKDETGVAGVSGGSVGSSAILVNGPDTTLDFSGLTSLSLAGNAYINIYNKGDIPSVGIGVAATDIDNVLMGESVAAKSDQMIYLVPPECIGYKGDECLLGTNPVSITRLNEYEQARTNASVEEQALYKEVNLEIVTSTGKKPSEYGATVKKLYKRIGGETTQLVYYYLEFSSQESANSFFRDYYTNNKSKVDDYVSHYIKEMKLGDFSSMNINLAGNMLYKDANNEFQLLEDTLTADTTDDDYQNSLTYYGKTYEALCTKLVKASTDIESEDYTRKTTVGLYANIIDEDVYNVPSNSLYLGNCKVGNHIQFGDDSDFYGLFIDNPTSDYTINVSSSDKLRVVVATGNVIVKGNYQGIIIAKGTIKLEEHASIKSDPAGVSAALQKKCTISGHGDENHYCVNLFREGHALAVSSTGGTGGTGETVQIEELIGYRNWSKQ